MTRTEDELLSDGQSVGAIGELSTRPPEFVDGRPRIAATARMRGVCKVLAGGVYHIRRPRLGELLTIQVDAVAIDAEHGTTELAFRICDKQPLDAPTAG